MTTALAMVAVAAAVVGPGPGLRRVADLPDGGPAFEVLDGRGAVSMRVLCRHGEGDPAGVAARLLSSQAVMAAILAKDGRIVLEDLGPVYFDCWPANAVPKGPIRPSDPSAIRSP